MMIIVKIISASIQATRQYKLYSGYPPVQTLFKLPANTNSIQATHPHKPNNKQAYFAWIRQKKDLKKRLLQNDQLVKSK